MATVYCRNCGEEVKGKFCTSCGTPIEASDQPAAADAGATSVIRSEDLLRKAQEELNPSAASQDATAGQSAGFPQPDTTAGQSTGYPTADPTAGQSAGYPQPDPTAPSPAQQGWQSPTPQSEQQWQNPTPQAGQGWQQPPPQQPPPSSGWSGAGQQPGGTPPPGSGGYYAQQVGLDANTSQAFSGTGPVVATTDIGQLFSGAFNILMSRLQTIVTIALVFAGLMAAVGVFVGVGALIGSKIAVLGLLFNLIGAVAEIVLFAVPVAAFVYMTQDAMAGTTSTPRELLERAREIVPTLAIALFITGIIVGVASLFLLIPGIIAAFLLVLVPQAVVLDGAGATGSLGLSSRMVRSDLGASVVATLVLYVAIAVASGVLLIILLPALLLLIIPVIGWAIYYALIGIIYGIVGAFALAYMTLLYSGLKAKAGMASPTPAYTGV